MIKKNYICKYILVFMLFCINSIPMAARFSVDGIYYEILSGRSNEVSVTEKPNGGTYSWTELVIPPQINYNGITYTVTQIKGLSNSSLLTSVVIPNTVTVIASSAFYNCGRLTEIEIPNSVTTIGSEAFKQCRELISISLSNQLTSIGSGAFESCWNLASITIPNGVSQIEDDTFRDCSHLASISIPSSITSIGRYSFRNCTNLTSIILPSGLTSIRYGAFDGCENLTEVNSRISTPFNVSCFTSIPDNSTLYVPIGTKNKYQALSGWSVFSNIIEKANTFSINITSSGNGHITYTGTTIRDGSKDFAIEEGTSATITLTPDNGYRVKSLTVNNTDVKASISNNQYTISNISTNTNVVAEFEAIPPTTYTLSIQAIGNGAVSYDNTAIKNKTTSFTVNEGTSAVITLTPDEGYRVKSLTVNNTDVKASISNNQYAISNISTNTNVVAEFEAIPPTTYTLSIQATGNGTVSYNNSTIKNKTTTFTVNEGTNATITLTPDDGYRIKSLTVNNADVKASISNNQYTISNISTNTNVVAEFEAIPPTTYSLSIQATGNGTISYDNTSIKNKTTSFTVNEGTSAVITLTPDEGYRVKSLTVNNTDVKASISNNQYTISNISTNTNVFAEFEAIPTTTYTLSIQATGNGTISYDNTSIKNKTASFTVNEGSSATITLTPDDGYRIKSLTVNNADVKANISNNQYTISNISTNTNVVAEFEAIPTTTYTLSIQATGNGTVSYNNSTIKNKTTTFTVNEGTNATITLTPDDGYRIKSLTVNNADVKASISNNQYTISNISSNTNVVAEFEAIPETRFTLSIKATGNGSASFNNTTIKNSTKTFSLAEGSVATILFTPDDGYRVKSLTIDGKDKKTSITNNQYTINSINADTNVEVEFEAIPETKYTLTIKATGNGKATYESTDISNTSKAFSIAEGSYANIVFTADEGYRIKTVKADNEDVTLKVENNQYSIDKISSDINIEVEFEEILETKYTLTIKASGNGVAKYGGKEIRNSTEEFTLAEGANAIINFAADEDNKIKAVWVNYNNVTSSISNNQYVIQSIASNKKVEVEFTEDLSDFESDGVTYMVVSIKDHTVNVTSSNYGLVLEVPATVTAKDKEWKVAGIEKNALKNTTDLAAIIWQPECAFTESVSNPNPLLYVKSADYAPVDIKNVIVNGKATSITLTDAASGNNFYCPEEFTAEQITYEHNYSMKTGYSTCQGWETIVLPFDVAVVNNNIGTELVPYSLWTRGDSKRPFWLYSMNEDGWQAESAIVANTPYIISMPNNDNYDATYNISGNIVFSASNATVQASGNLTSSKHGHRNLVPNYQNRDSNPDIYALNVNNLWDQNTDSGLAEGSAFVRGSRQTRPFEAYMTIDSGSATTRSIGIFDDDNTTGIMSLPLADSYNDGVIRVYSISGVLLKQGSDEKVIDELPKGIYVVNGKKVIK